MIEWKRMYMYIPYYMTKFSLDKNFAKPTYLCIAEVFGGINFRQCSKGRHILNVIINTGQNFRVYDIHVHVVYELNPLKT